MLRCTPMRYGVGTGAFGSWDIQLSTYAWRLRYGDT
jgi:hypothetical protein